MADIFQTIFPNAFSWMKMYEIWLTFYWSLFLRVDNIPCLHPHVCISSVNFLRPRKAYMCKCTRSWLVAIIVFRHFVAIHYLDATYYQFTIMSNFESNCIIWSEIHRRKFIWKYRIQNGGLFSVSLGLLMINLKASVTNNSRTHQ